MPRTITRYTRNQNQMTKVARAPARLERDTPLVALAAARQVVEEASLWLAEPLPDAYARRLARVARATYTQSKSFRDKLARSRQATGDERDCLYAFMRHWLAAGLQRDRPALFARLPQDYAWGGAELPPPHSTGRATRARQLTA